MEKIYIENPEEGGLEKVRKSLGENPLPSSVAKFIIYNYKEVTGVNTGGKDPKTHPIIKEIVEYYKFDPKNWDNIWGKTIKHYIP